MIRQEFQPLLVFSIPRFLYEWVVSVRLIPRKQRWRRGLLNPVSTPSPIPFRERLTTQKKSVLKQNSSRCAAASFGNQSIIVWTSKTKSLLPSLYKREEFG